MTFFLYCRTCDLILTKVLCTYKELLRLAPVGLTKRMDNARGLPTARLPTTIEEDISFGGVLDRLILGGITYSLYEYTTEKEFEKLIVEFAPQIFGPRSIYINVKKRIGKEIVSIPDGYLIDFSFPRTPRLYIIENELGKHDPYRHIGQQILRFAISYKDSGREIKAFLLDHILGDNDKKALIEEALGASGHRNVDAFFEYLIFDNPVAAVVVIDQSTAELENVLNQLTMKTDIVEFQTYFHDSERVHRFTPFQEELREITEAPRPPVDIEKLDTIVVPAREEGFQKVFIGENCWYSIRISSSMLERIKYIAAYQVAPVSAITHYAEVERIEKYADTAKYILYFKEPARNVGPVGQVKKKVVTPQAPRYTTMDKLLKASTMDEVF